MGGDENFYDGSGGIIKPDYGDPIGNAYSGQISVPADPRNANQIKAVTERINLGAKSIEVGMLFPDKVESIPNQHLEEINRLRKLAGVDLTVHGPLIEPTGWNPESRSWSPEQRVFAERQILSAVERAQKVKKGQGENVIVTIHASNGMIEPETKMIVEENGKKKEVITALGVIDERTGGLGRIPLPDKNYLTGEEPDIKASLEEMNRRQWLEQIRDLSIGADRASISRLGESFGEDEEKRKIANELVKARKDGTYDEMMKKYSGEEQRKLVQQVEAGIMNEYDRANAWARNAYNNLQELYNKAYDVAKQEGDKETKAKLDALRGDMQDVVKKYKNDPSTVDPYELTGAINKGLRVLEEIKAPQIYKPIRDFAIDKTAETFGNVAFHAYEKFGTDAPIISIENPPAGSGLNRGEDLKAVVVASQKKLAAQLVEKQGLSESEAKEQAEKLIGATWDVGHINMIRKYGYGEEQLREETKAIAKYVKHVHLSDNFGLDHTEIPMGMGNVPMKAHLEELKKAHGDKLKELKMVSETGNWFEPFGTVPFVETLQAFGSPIYGMHMSPSWNQSVARGPVPYSSGYGTMLPDVHFQTYGAGFSMLPPELGGQMSGRSRMSGNPMD
jgi:sugar phosphate isomerase/epimerase